MNLTAYQRIHSFSLLFYFHLFESLFIKRYLLLQALTESAKLCVTSVLMSYVPRALPALVLYVLSYPTCLEPYVPHASRASYYTCSRASCLTCSRALRVSCLTCSRASGASRAMRNLVVHVSCALRFLVLLVRFCFSSITCFRCLKPNIFIYISCLVVHLVLELFCVFHNLG